MVLNWEFCGGMTTSYLMEMFMHKNKPVWGSDGAELEHLQRDDDLVFNKDVYA